MYKHLFLQGDIDIGKSTIIRDCVRPFLKDIGGYYTVKLFVDNKKSGFAIRPVKNDIYYQLRLDVDDICKVPGLFMCKNKGDFGFKTDIFVNKATNYLTNSFDKKLIIIDEIGGLELKSSKFIKILSKILKGDIPILGVIKAKKNLLRLSKSAKFNIRFCMQFLNELYSCDHIKILNVEKHNRKKVKNIVFNFVNNALINEGFCDER